jgi:hypothetical protein
VQTEALSWTIERRGASKPRSRRAALTCINQTSSRAAVPEPGQQREVIEFYAREVLPKFK